MDKIKIAIIDDQTLMRDGLKTILDLEDDMEVIWTAEDGKKGYAQISEVRPDVILMDIRMPNLNGVEATKLVKDHFKEIKVIILTTFDDDEYIIEALAYGASGYLLKDMHGDKLIQAIRDAYNGDMIMPASVAAKLAVKLSKNPSASEENTSLDIKDLELTEREIDICRLLVSGYSNKAISDKLFISIGTVKNYITNIYSKIGVDNRTAAAVYLKKLGL